MDCNEVEIQLDDYLDHSCGSRGSIDDRTAAAIAMHVQGCPDCEAELERRYGLLNDLRSMPVPAPTADFFEKSVSAAVAADADPAALADSSAHNRRRDDARRPYSTVITGLAAAMLVAVLLGSVVFAPPTGSAPDSGFPSISLATDTVTPIKLAFSSEKALADARLSLTLPVGVELMGYDGRSDFSWTTDLEAGTNVLRLPLVGRMAANDLLVARLEHSSGTKTFRLQVTVNDNGAPEHE
jgi:hypothetical protein